MPRTPLGTALPALLLAVFLASAFPAHASEFAPKWHQPFLAFDRIVGNTDTDPQDELLFYDVRDNAMLLLDGLTGAVEIGFPEFLHGDADVLARNIDNDARLELVLYRRGGGPTAPLMRAIKWTPGGWTQLFAHNDPMSVVGFCSLRSPSQVELLEISDTDVRVRDMAGAVLLRASTAIGSWTGAEVSAFSLDVDADGIDELGVTQHLFSSDTHTQFFNWNGAFVPTWSTTGWFLTGGENTDGDPQIEMFGWNKLDGHHALFDGVTGATDLSLPEFKFLDNAHVEAFDIDGDGRREVFGVRPAGPGVTPLLHAYKWSLGNYVTMFSTPDSAATAYPVQTRAANQWEYFVEKEHDFLLRDMNGGLLFRAATAIPGWSGVAPRVAQVDLNHDGAFDLVIQDDNTVRVVRHVAGSYVQSWSSTAWRHAGMAPKTDGNANEAVIVISNADGHYALLDPLTGAVRAEFPLFTDADAGLAPIDFDHDGQYELLFTRFFGPTRLAICYRWNGSSYAQLYSHQDEPASSSPGPFRTPGASELLEMTPDNLRLRMSNGSLIFVASTDVPLWTGVGTSSAVLDVDHDGVDEFLAADAGGTRLVGWTGTVGVEDGRDALVAARLTSSPNPFRSTTSLQFSTRSEGQVGIAIYDASGRLVRRLDQRLPAGSHAVKWDGRDARGHAAPNGVLFYEVRADGMKQTRKMVHIGS